MALPQIHSSDHDAGRILVGKRLQQHAIGDAENRGGRSQSQGERGHSRQGKQRVLAQHPDCNHESLQRHAWTSCAQVVRDW